MAIKPLNRELASAISRGDGVGVLQALRMGANPNTAVGGQDMLYRAWKGRRQQIFQVLMEHGGRMHGANEGREAVLLARAGWLDLLAMAVERDWQMEVQIADASSDGRTVAGELVRRGDRDGLRMIAGLGHDIRKGEIDRLRAPGRWKCTLSMLFSENTHSERGTLVDLLDVLLAHPPRDAMDSRDVGKALADWIVYRHKSPAVVDQVLEQVRQSPWWTADMTSNMASQLACRAHRPALVQQLARENPSIIQGDDTGATHDPGLLHGAIEGARSAMCKDPRAMLVLVQDLLALGADPNARYQGLNTVQHLMMGDGKQRDSDFELFDALLSAGADPLDSIEPIDEQEQPGYRRLAGKNWEGATMAHFLAWHLQEKMPSHSQEGADYMRKLIDRVPQLLQATDPHGMTPLHSAIMPRACMLILADKRLCLPMAKTLVELGANPAAKWNNGRNMLHAISSAWKQGLKPVDGDDLLVMIRQVAPQLWDEACDNGITGAQALENIYKPEKVSAGPTRKR